jgi:hypothetical protein
VKSNLNLAIARLARDQGGHVTTAQLLELGLGRRAVQYRVARGLLMRVHHGVYAVGHLPTSPADRAHGALLAAGPGSALCGRSAAALWMLYQHWPEGPLELVAPRRLRIPTLALRRCTSLLSRDLRVQAGLRVTSAARTLLDIAPQTRTRDLHCFHNELRMRRLIGNDALVDVARRNPRHPGSAKLLALAGASDGEAKRSALEIDWQRFAARYGLPEYSMNVLVCGVRVDVLFTPGRLIVELDGWSTHGTRRAFEADRGADAMILAASGVPTVRITREGLRSAPSLQAGRLAAILSRYRVCTR